MLIFEGKTQERKMTDQIKKNMDIKEDQESLKKQEKKNKKIDKISISPLIFFIIILFQEVVFDISFKV